MLINPTCYDELTFEQKISLNLRLARAKANISVETLALSLKIEPKVLRTIESIFLTASDKRRKLSFDEVKEICKALQIPISKVVPLQEE